MLKLDNKFKKLIDKIFWTAIVAWNMSIIILVLSMFISSMKIKELTKENDQLKYQLDNCLNNFKIWEDQVDYGVIQIHLKKETK